MRSLGATSARMSDTEKPFVCPSTGCNMSFTSEDNLIVHKKKHDMVLNLENNGKSTGFVADQTPTPTTRFIRNCEEVGLFQDLQNVNPFEETFRRAVEAGNTGTLSVPEAGITDDTLHTPHIFPHIADVLSSNSQILPETNVEECSDIISIAEKSAEERSVIGAEVCSTVKLNSDETQDLIKDVKLSSKTESLVSDSIIVQDANALIAPKITSTQLSPELLINGEEVQLLLKTADGKLMQLSAVPVCEFTNASTSDRSKQQTVVIKTEPPLRCAIDSDAKKPVTTRLSLAKMKLREILPKCGSAQNQKIQKSLDKGETLQSKKAVDQSKKKEILERNRASSMRARAKRKAWIQQLERTVTNVNDTNVALQMEVKALRSEVAKLKTLLLAHKDCPVTKAMQKGNGIILDPKIISINPDVLASINNIPIKRSSSEASNVPKKKLVSTKNPPIFPKVDCNTALPISNATIVKTLPTLKIMGVSQFITEKEEAKQILIVQNPPRKLDDTSPRQIIQINPNYEMEHAASKSTGA